MGAIEVLCLGTGTSSAPLTSGVAASTSFVILMDGSPVALIGVGSGTMRALYKYVGECPNTVIVLSDSLEQTAEIPLLIEAEVVGKGRRLALFGASSAAVAACNVLVKLYYPQLHLSSSSSAAGKGTDGGGLYSPLFSQLLGRDSGRETSLNVSTFTAVSSCPTPLQPSGGGGADLVGGLPLSSPRCGSILIAFRGLPCVAFASPTDALSSDTLEWLCQSPMVYCWTAPRGVTSMQHRVPFDSIVRWFTQHHASAAPVNSANNALFGGGFSVSSGWGVGGGSVASPTQQQQLLSSPAGSSAMYAAFPSASFASSLPASAMANTRLPPPAHCILCGWGNAVDEPLLMDGSSSQAPRFFSLAPQGSLVPVLMGDFVQPNAPSTTVMLRTAAERDKKIVGSVRSAHQQQYGPPTPPAAATSDTISSVTMTASPLDGNGGSSSQPFVYAAPPPPLSAPQPRQHYNYSDASFHAQPPSPHIPNGAVGGGHGASAPPSLTASPIRPSAPPPTATSAISAATRGGNAYHHEASPRTPRGEEKSLVAAPHPSTAAKAITAAHQHPNEGDSYHDEKEQWRRTNENSSPKQNMKGIANALTATAVQKRNTSATKDVSIPLTSHETAETGSRRTSNHQQQQPLTAPRRAVSSSDRIAAYRRPSSAASSASGGGGGGGGPSLNGLGSRMNYVDTRRVRVFNNDNKGHEGKTFLMKNYRQLNKFSEAIAQQLGIMPIAALVLATDGRRLTSLDEVPPNGEIIAVRRGGAPFDAKELPRGVGMPFS